MRIFAAISAEPICSTSSRIAAQTSCASSGVAVFPVPIAHTGKTATPDDAQEVCAAIRLELADIGSDEIAQNARILYGGSVKSANIVEIMRQSDIDGALVGGASLDAEEFARLCKFHRVL